MSCFHNSMFSFYPSMENIKRREGNLSNLENEMDPFLLKRKTFLSWWITKMVDTCQIFLAVKQALTFRNFTHRQTDKQIYCQLLTFLVEYRAMQEFAGIFRDTQGQSVECLVMQGIHWNTGEYRRIQENTGEYRGIKGIIVKLSGKCIYKRKGRDSRQQVQVH